MMTSNEDRVLLRGFLVWLMERTARLTQIEIARQAEVSQSVINKVLVGSGIRRYADIETYKKVAAAFSTEWVQYFREHPKPLETLRQDFDWVLAACSADQKFSAGDKTLAQRPGYREALSHVNRIFTESSETPALLLNLLRAFHAENGRERTEPAEVPARSKRR
jgi:hypothetical protein